MNINAQKFGTKNCATIEPFNGSLPLKNQIIFF